MVHEYEYEKSLCDGGLHGAISFALHANDDRVLHLLSDEYDDDGTHGYRKLRAEPPQKHGSFRSCIAAKPRH